jgi:hypothetical protein
MKGFEQEIAGAKLGLPFRAKRTEWMEGVHANSYQGPDSGEHDDGVVSAAAMV